MNTATNELQFMSDLNNDNNPEECLKLDRATKDVTGHKLCVYRNEIEAKGTSNKSLMISSKLGALPGFASDYYPVVKTPFTNLYFSTNGAYNAYLGSSNVGELDFTGQHRCVPNNASLDISLNVGKIVISNGVINSLVQDASGIYQPTTGKNAITVNDSIPVVKLSSSYQDKRVFGVISEGLDDDANGNKFYTTGALNSVLPCDPSDNRLYINSVGEGAVWVCNDQGDIQNGDYITTSAISEGYGTKQTDDILHNYTVAKSTMSCDFELDSANYECREITYNSQTYRIALIACTYHCG